MWGHQLVPLLHGQPGLGSDCRQLPRKLRTFLTEQRVSLRELGDLISALRALRQPVFLLADPHDTLIPARTIHQLATVFPECPFTSSTRSATIFPAVGARDHGGDR